MGASDYVVVPSPQGPSYAAPLVGFQLGQALADLPDAFMKGRQNARTIAMQRPIIDPNTGEPSNDPNVVAKELMRRGGAEYSEKLLPFLQKQPIFDRILRENNEGGYDAPPQSALPAGPPPSRPNASAAGPGNLTAPPQRQPQAQPAPGMPRLSSAGTDDRGPQTINSLASEVFGARDVTNLLPKYAGAVRNNLGEPLTPEQEQTARALMQRTAASMGKSAGAGGPPSGAPAPAGGRAPNAVAQVGAGMATVDNAGPGPGAAAAAGTAPAADDAATLRRLGVPEAYLDQPERYIAGQRKRAEAIRRQGDLRGVVGIPSKSKEDQAAAIDKQMDAIESFIQKSNEPTEAMKVYRAGRNPGESLVDFQARQAAAKKGAEEEQSAVGKTMEKMAVDGLDAVGHQAMLETVRRLGEKVPYGIIPKIQSELGKFGIETKGLSDIQAYERAIDYMAPQLRPIGSGRLMQQELTAFKASLGGLMTTPEGREISVENLKLLSTYKEAIGRIAADHNIPMRQRMEEIYKIPPPHLKTLDDVRGGAKSSASAQKIADKAAYDALPKGAVFTGPDGKSWRKP